MWREADAGLKTCNLSATVKHVEGSVMVWECFSYFGVGKLVFIEGKMNAEYYVNILSNNLPDSARLINLKDYIFQQDNDPKNTAKLYFEPKQFKLLSLPAKSLDLNPIETLWAIIKQKLSQYRLKNLNELKEIIVREWQQIPSELCQKLTLNFYKKSLACFGAKRNHIKYQNKKKFFIFRFM